MSCKIGIDCCGGVESLYTFRSTARERSSSWVDVRLMTVSLARLNLLILRTNPSTLATRTMRVMTQGSETIFVAKLELILISNRVRTEVCMENEIDDSLQQLVFIDRLEEFWETITLFEIMHNQHQRALL